ncbi:LysR family transcriptional regulator [Halalkalibacter urbisdiaboli]|uniref:LysR family transcriptional regulator n=1 Tax=Halalkalibacter urbisdiaboli TaxID=1960589 RepID=UPI001FD9A516|nr:LysR family transcriptional regulator [Halalkalibacter urbisdiaboli]
MQTFKAIVDFGGFTKAAEQLGYAQSTITFHIKCIEEELGEPVFDRIGKKVLLTETGKFLMVHAIKMLNIYRDIKEVSSISGEIKGKLVISAPEALLIYRLPPLIKEFKEKYPKVDIQLKHLDPLKLQSDLSEGEVDLAFIIDTERKNKGIYFEELVNEPMMFISADFISLKEVDSLHNRVYLFTEEGCIYRRTFKDLLSEKLECEGEKLNRNSIEFWSIDALKECVICGLGVAILPYISVEKDIIQNKIFAQEVQTDKKISTYLAYHEEKWLSPSLKAFLEIIRNYANEWRTDEKTKSKELQDEFL